MKTTVLGAGSWGTALAHHLARSGKAPVLWGRNAEVLNAIRETRKNPRYLNDLELSSSIVPEASLEKALADAENVIFAVASVGTRELARTAKAHIRNDALVVSTAKGLEEGTHRRMSAVLGEELGEPARVTVLSGPTFAREVARGLPTAVAAAGGSSEWTQRAANLFHSESLRVYRSTDVVGVELGGCVKNVIAVAAGIVEGLGLGLNAQAAIITRGLAEMMRLIEKAGGRPNTVMGLSGLGDLLLTATGDLSRNRKVGVALGKGATLEHALADLGEVAEGVKAAKQVLSLAGEWSIEMPIALEVSRIIAGDVTPQQAVRNLLSRALRDE